MELDLWTSVGTDIIYLYLSKEWDELRKALFSPIANPTFLK